MNPLKPRPLLRGKRVLLLFYEASTRTRSSFEIAAKSLGAMTTLVLSSGSSIEKGESLLDTGYTLRAVGADVIVIRHPQAGAAALMARYLDIPVINAGDGMHEHPSQALLDATRFCATRKRSRDCRSPSSATFITAGWRGLRFICSASSGRASRLCGPAEFLPENRDQPGAGVAHHAYGGRCGAWRRRGTHAASAKRTAGGTKISLQDYIARYQMTMARLKLAKKDAMLMHPGPIIRGLELTWEVADCPQSVIVEEVRNGVPVRMAILARKRLARRRG